MSLLLAPKKQETGVRLYEDQIRRLDLLVALCGGRKGRSTLIREAIDAMLEQRLRDPSHAKARR